MKAAKLRRDLAINSVAQFEFLVQTACDYLDMFRDQLGRTSGFLPDQPSPKDHEDWLPIGHTEDAEIFLDRRHMRTRIHLIYSPETNRATHPEGSTSETIRSVEALDTLDASIGPLEASVGSQGTTSSENIEALTASMHPKYLHARTARSRSHRREKRAEESKRASGQAQRPSADIDMSTLTPTELFTTTRD